MKKVVLVVLAAALVATSCSGPAGEPADRGDGPGSPIAEPTGAATPDAAAPLERIDPREGGFEVGFGEWAVTLEAPAIRPGEVEFVVRNGGTLVHGFEIESDDEDGRSNRGPGGGDDDDDFKFETRRFGPGEELRFTLDLAPGIYEIECFVADHDDLGMRAFLEVREDAPLVETGGAADGVRIEGFEFRPPTVEVAVGEEVSWTNRDPTPHTATATDGSFDSQALEQGGAFTHTFDAAGEYAYLCSIHPEMTGLVRVTA